MFTILGISYEFGEWWDIVPHIQDMDMDIVQVVDFLGMTKGPPSQGVCPTTFPDESPSESGSKIQHESSSQRSSNYDHFCPTPRRTVDGD